MEREKKVKKLEERKAQLREQQKKLDEQDLLYYRDRFKVPLTDKQVKNIEYFKPDERN